MVEIILILGVALLGIVAIIFINSLIKIILKFILYILILGLASAALISYVISESFEWDFWLVFPITLIISVLLISFIIDNYQPEHKKVSKESTKTIEEDSSVGILNSAKNAISSAKDKVKDKVNDNIKDEVKSVGKSVTGTLKNTVKKGLSIFSNQKEIDKMNAIRFNSSHLTDEQLVEYVKNKSIDLYEKIGYAAALADRYPLEK